MMRRIISLVVVALVIAAMMLVMAMPTFAAPNCVHGQDQALANAVQRGDDAGIAKHQENSDDCSEGLPPGEGHDK
jgi:beta-lactam-binding protein with PASTA domain